jgi:hypothetical protein
MEQDAASLNVDLSAGAHVSPGVDKVDYSRSSR